MELDICDVMIDGDQMRVKTSKCRHARALALGGLLPPLGGCTSGAAPSFVLFGAYFPGWMFCALVGILGALGARLVLLESGLAEELPFQLGICVSTGVILGIAVWLVWFGR